MNPFDNFADPGKIDLPSAHNNFLSNLNNITAGYLYGYLDACLKNSYYHNSGIENVRIALDRNSEQLISPPLINLIAYTAQTDPAYINRLTCINMLKKCAILCPQHFSSEHKETLKKVAADDKNHLVRTHANDALHELALPTWDMIDRNDPHQAAESSDKEFNWSDNGIFYRILLRHYDEAFTSSRYWSPLGCNEDEDSCQYPKGNINRIHSLANACDCFWTDLQNNKDRLTPELLYTFAKIGLKCEESSVRIRTMNGLNNLTNGKDFLCGDLLKTISFAAKRDPSYLVRSLGLHFFSNHLPHSSQKGLSFIANTMIITCQNIVNRAKSEGGHTKTPKHEEWPNCRAALTILREIRKRDYQMKDEEILTLCMEIASDYEGRGARSEAIQTIADIVSETQDPLDEQLGLFLLSRSRTEEEPTIAHQINQIISAAGIAQESPDHSDTSDNQNYGITTGKNPLLTASIDPDCKRPLPRSPVALLQQTEHL